MAVAGPELWLEHTCVEFRVRDETGDSDGFGVGEQVGVGDRASPGPFGKDGLRDPANGAFAGPLQDGGLDQDAAWGEGPAVVVFGGDEFGEGVDVVLCGAEPAPVSGADPPDAEQPPDSACSLGAAQAEGAVDDVGAVDHGGRCEGVLVECAEAAPCLQPFRGPAVAGLGEGSGLGEGAFGLLDGRAVAGCVAGGVADQALAVEDPGGDGERLDHWARFSPRLWLPADRAARVWWCSSEA